MIEETIDEKKLYHAEMRGHHNLVRMKKVRINKKKSKKDESELPGVEAPSITPIPISAPAQHDMDEEGKHERFEKKNKSRKNRSEQIVEHTKNPTREDKDLGLEEKTESLPRVELRSALKPPIAAARAVQKSPAVSVRFEEESAKQLPSDAMDSEGKIENPISKHLTLKQKWIRVTYCLMFVVLNLGRSV